MFIWAKKRQLIVDKRRSAESPLGALAQALSCLCLRSAAITALSARVGWK
jgi:hypothetical protein